MYASWEDTVVDFMAPRSGKTTAQAIPFVLSAPGPVIATSNKSDLWAATAALREQATGGRVWLFDPQHITYQPQTWWWNLLDGLRTVEDAHRLAGHFVLTVADEQRRDLWGPAAQDLLSALFLAAASAGLTLHDVAGWLNEPAVPTPAELLMDAGFTAMAASLRGAQNGAAETRDGIYQTARTAAKAMTDPQIMAWVTPPRRGAAPGLRPRRVRRQPRHPVPAVEVPVRGGPADRRAVRHRDAGRGTPRGTARRAAGPAAGGAAG